jgi:hypothetical protein
MPAEPTPRYWFEALVCHEVRARGEAFPGLRQLQIEPAYAEAPSALQALPMNLCVAEFPRRLPKRFPHEEFGMSDRDRPQRSIATVPSAAAIN